MFRDLVVTVLGDSNIAAVNRVKDKGNALFTLMAYFHCRTQIQIQTWIRIPNSMAT